MLKQLLHRDNFEECLDAIQNPALTRQQFSDLMNKPGKEPYDIPTFKTFVREQIFKWLFEEKGIPEFITEVNSQYMIGQVFNLFHDPHGDVSLILRPISPIAQKLESAGFLIPLLQYILEQHPILFIRKEIKNLLATYQSLD